MSWPRSAASKGGKSTAQRYGGFAFMRAAKQAKHGVAASARAVKARSAKTGTMLAHGTTRAFTITSRTATLRKAATPKARATPARRTVSTKTKRVR